MTRTEEKVYRMYAIVAGMQGHVVYTTEPARAVYRDHRNGKYAATSDLFAGEKKVEMYKLEELKCTQQVAKIRRGVWSLWLHSHGYQLVSETAQEQVKTPDRRDLAAVKRIKLRPKSAFTEKNDIASAWVFPSTRRTLSFPVSVEEYAEVCHQAADVTLPLSTYCRERFYNAMPFRQSISELQRCLQQAETAGRLADAFVKQGILARTDPRDYENLAIGILALRDATAELTSAIHELIRKEP